MKQEIIFHNHLLHSVYFMDINLIIDISLWLATLILLWLAFVDFKTFRLPNIGVLGFALLAFPYRLIDDFTLHNALDMVYGLLAALIMLGLIRYLANKHYGRETFGIGDIKLLMAGGLWLGFPAIISAIALGAIAGIFVGLIAFMLNREDGQKLGQTKFAAGPGFIAGLLLMIYKPAIESYFMLEFPL